MALSADIIVTCVAGITFIPLLMETLWGGICPTVDVSFDWDDDDLAVVKDGTLPNVVMLIPLYTII